MCQLADRFVINKIGLDFQQRNEVFAKIYMQSFREGEMKETREEERATRKKIKQDIKYE